MGDWGRRWYSPSMARFVSEDPIGEKGGLNLYAFVRNNPVSLHDIRGLFTRAECCDAKETATLRSDEAEGKKKAGLIRAFFAREFDYERVQKIFGTTTAGNINLVRQFYNATAGVAEKIEKYFNDNKYDVKCVWKVNYNCWLRGADLFEGNNRINVCPSYFGHQSIMRSALFVHEISHLSASTGDDYKWAGLTKDIVKHARIAQMYEELTLKATSADAVGDQYYEWLQKVADSINNEK